MVKSKSAIIAVAFVALVIIVAVAYYFSGSDDKNNFDRTGDWYMVDYEVMNVNYSDPESSHLSNGSFVLSSKKYPITFDWIEDNMFSGKMENFPIIGGITSDYICFQVCDEKLDIYAYMEGRFFGKALTLSVITFADSEMIHVISGSFVKYVHESSSVIPDTAPAPDFSKLELTNGQGKYFFFNSENDLTSQPYGAQSFEYIYCGTNIALMKSQIAHPTQEVSDTLYSLCIFRENVGGTINCAYAGTSKDVFFGGGIVIGDNELHTYIYSRGGKFMTYSNSVYDVDYPHGKINPSTYISGVWSGTLKYSYGEEIITGKPLMDKDFTFFEHCFGCVETISPDESYVWIGSIYGNGAYVICEHEGKYYTLFGVLNGDVMTLSGFLIEPDGRYMAIKYELKKV